MVHHRYLPRQRLSVQKIPEQWRNVDIGAGQRGKEFRRDPTQVRIPSPTTEIMASRSVTASGPVSLLSVPGRTLPALPVQLATVALWNAETDTVFGR